MTEVLHNSLPEDTVAVIGSGIGGLTMGLSLKSQNIPAVIFESAPQIKTVGAGIVLAINAMQVYEKLGLKEIIENNGHKIHQMNITKPNFSMLSSVKLKYFEGQYHLTNIAIHRSDLHNLLSETFGKEQIKLNKKLVDISFEDGCYSLKFEDGTSENFKYVIGADGIKSKVRNLLFSENELRQSGQICWRGVIETDLPEAFLHKATECWGKGSRFGFTKINDTQTYWYFLINESMGNLESNPLDFVDEYSELVKNMIEATPQKAIFTDYLYDLKPIQKWNLQNLCLIGDAAHATTPNLGQGACQAIEDAYVLGELLKKYPIKQAFEQYPEIRRYKAHYVVNTSWNIGKIAQLSNPFMIGLRNVALKLAPEKLNQKQMAHLFELEKVH